MQTEGKVKSLNNLHFGLALDNLFQPVSVQFA